MAGVTSGNAEADRRISYNQAMEAEELAKKKRKQELMDQQFDTDLAKTKAAREQDMAEGRKRGDELFSEGSMGRIEAGRPTEIASIIDQRRQQLSGFTPEEMNTMEGKANKGIGEAEYLAQRTLRGQQGRLGLSGGAAAQQVGSISRAANKARAESDADLFLKQIDAKRSALNSYESSVGSALGNEQNATKFNIDQKNKELMNRLTTEFGYAGLGASERSAIMQKLVGQEQADALMEQAKNSGGKK